MYDAIVVGGRVAGSPTAMLLARKGYRVLVVDQATFPSDTISTHHIHRAGLATANRWGLLPRLIGTGGPRIRRWTFDVGPFAITGNPLPAGDIDFDLCPRRTVLDKTLVDAASEAGAEVREGVAVQGLLRSENSVCGIEAQTSAGTVIRERARIVIGADGRRSRVAQLAGAPTYNARPALTVGYYSYWSGLDLTGVELYPREGAGIVAEVTNEGLVYVASAWRRSMFDVVREDISTWFMRNVQECAPSLAERMQAATRVAPFKGADFPFFFRQPFGDGWALVGDAGYHRDAITGQGITDAFRDAEVLADAVDGYLRGSADALPAYEAKRNAAVMPMYEFTYKLAKLEAPTEQEQQMFGMLRENQHEAERFLSLIAGTVSIPEFFAAIEQRASAAAAAAG